MEGVMIENYIKETDYMQLSKEEILYMINFITGRKYKMLVFGCGADTNIWASVNKGETVFLEHNQNWIDKFKNDFDIQKVEYTTKATQWKDLLNKPNELKIELPFGIKDIAWNIIFVDSPVGNEHGRMQSIYMASMLASRNCNTHIFVHDCEREIEKAYCDKYLGHYKLIKQIRKLRHYKT